MFHYFTIKFHFSFFASFRFKFFASLHFSHFCFEVKQSEAKFKSIFPLFHFFFAIFHIFRYFFACFCLFSLFFALHFSPCFNLVIFASKRNEAKRNSSLFFCSFSFFSLFFTFFRFFFAFFVLLRFFHLIFTYFTFVFASDFWCFASKWIMWNQAIFRFQAKRNFCFNFKFRFRSESEGHPRLEFSCFLDFNVWIFKTREEYDFLQNPLEEGTMNSMEE